MKNLKTHLPYLSLFDAKGRHVVFVGGVFTPEDDEQAEWLKANYKQISDATDEDGAPATMQQLRDYQATETLKSLDVSANVSESETGKLKPANTATMAAITAGITPTQPLIKVPAKGK